MSVDSPERNATLRRRLSSPITFLSDPTLALIDSMAIPYKRRTKGEGPLAIPSQFLVDRDGVIRWKFISDTWRRRLPAKSVLAAVTAVIGALPS